MVFVFSIRRKLRTGYRCARWRHGKWILLAAAYALSPPGAAPLSAAEIHGTIHITHRLTKQRVTPSATAYQRGVVVPPVGAVADFTQAELGRVAIYLESDDHLPSKRVAVVLAQKGRQFVEDTVVIPAGSTVSFPNLDPIFHNVFSLSGAKSFDLGNYAQNETRSVTFTKPGIVRVYCHLHPNMSASIVVTPNRWSVKPNSDGRYQLPAIPPGEHTVVVWHKSAGFFRERIRLAGDDAVRVNFTIPVGAESETAQAR